VDILAQVIADAGSLFIALTETLTENNDSFVTTLMPPPPVVERILEFAMEPWTERSNDNMTTQEDNEAAEDA